MNSPVAALQRRGAREGRRAAAGLLRPVRREGGGVAAHDARASRRDRAGPRVDRAAGEGERPGGRARRPRARDRARQAEGEDRRRRARWNWWSTRRGSSLYEMLAAQLGGSDERLAAARRCSGATERRALGIARARRATLFRPGEPLALMPFGMLAVEQAARRRAEGGSSGLRPSRTWPDEPRSAASRLILPLSLPDHPLQVLPVDLDLHLLLRLQHVGAEEAAAALVQQLVAQAVARGGELRGRRLLVLDAP